MRNELVFLLILSLTMTSVKCLIDCNVSLPRLLIGEKYSNSTSNETALIMFDTLDICDQATLILSNGPSFSFKLKEIITQYVDSSLDHSGTNREYVKYQKYSIVFAIDALPGVTYSVGFQGNKTLSDTIYQTIYEFTLPQPTQNMKSKNALSQQKPLKFLFFGDQDLTQRGMNQLNYLTSHTNQMKFDSLIFLGDYAYEFYQNNGQKGDQYLAKLTPLSFSYPLVMTPGNHEESLNFTIFNEKFRMPSYSIDNLNNFNSFDIGNVHFIHVNLHFYSITNNQNQAKMLAWIDNDLSKVDRTQTPWVIGVGHKLIYCYDPNFQDNLECQNYETLFSKIEQLFNKHNLDIFVTGHEHYNQIMGPLNGQNATKYQFDNSTGDLILNYGGFVSIIQGNGGCFNSLPGRILSEPLELVNKGKQVNTQYNDILKNSSLYYNPNSVGFGWIEVFNSTYLEYTSYDSEKDVVLKKIRIHSTHGLISSSIINGAFSLVVAFIFLMFSF